jgi:hypothetical protein
MTANLPESIDKPPSEPGSSKDPELDSDGLPAIPKFPDYNDPMEEQAREKFRNAPTDPAPPMPENDEDDRITILEFPLHPKPLPGMHLPSSPGKEPKSSG